MNQAPAPDPNPRDKQAWIVPVWIMLGIGLLTLIGYAVLRYIQLT